MAASDSEIERALAETAAFNAKHQAWAAALLVRGRPNYEWIPTIDQLKRRGSLDKALALTIQCAEAARRADAVADDGTSVWASWVVRTCIILRKMGRIDDEVALLERAVGELPNRHELLDRLRKARTLADRRRRE